MRHPEQLGDLLRGKASLQASFRKSTSKEVHRVMILESNVDETEASIEEVFAGSAAALQALEGEYLYVLKKLKTAGSFPADLKVIARGESGDHSVLQCENGTIVVETVSIREPVARSDRDRFDWCREARHRRPPR